MKWSNKLNDLEQLMRAMLSQINEKRMQANRSENGEKVFNIFRYFMLIKKIFIKNN